MAFPIIFLIFRVIAVKLIYIKDTPAYYFEINDEKNARFALLETYKNKYNTAHHIDEE